MEMSENKSSTNILVKIGHFANVTGAIFVVGNFLIWMNLIPSYEFKRVPSKSVEPKIFLFPAQKIQLNPGFFDGTQVAQIEKAEWYLKKNGKEAYRTEGLQPTFSMPPTEGGIYQLEVKLKLLDEAADRTGVANIYVVQTEDKKTVTTKSKIVEKITSNRLSEELLKAAKSNGIEVYEGLSKWKTLPGAQIDSTSITIPENTEFASFNGQLMFRVRGDEKDLNKYNAIAAPAGAVMVTPNHSPTGEGIQ